MADNGFTKEEALQIAHIDLTDHNELEILIWLWDTAFQAGQQDVFTRGSLSVTQKRPNPTWTEYR